MDIQSYVGKVYPSKTLGEIYVDTFWQERNPHEGHVWVYSEDCQEAILLPHEEFLEEIQGDHSNH